MSRKKILALLSAVVGTAALAIGVPVLGAGSASAATPCASAWSSSAVYTGGMTASYQGDNWTAKWWTQGDVPGSAVGVWASQGACGGSGAPSPSTPAASCNYPAWVAGTSYTAGSIVQYTANGQYYQASHDNPGYDPTISTWYWNPYSCTGTSGGGTTPPSSSGFVVSEAQFNQMFPNRNAFYTYSGLVAALSAYPGFATTGSATVQKQEAAAFLANVDHETGGLVYVVEQNTADYSTYCDRSQSYGCPAGQSAYYGRGPIQLSWNFNYKAAGDALGIDLLDNPNLVQTDASVAWKTGLWYWDTQTGPGSMTAHNAMVSGAGFGQTIRAINGSLECNGNNTAEMQNRINDYQQFVQILGVSAGSNLSC